MSLSAIFYPKREYTKGLPYEHLYIPEIYQEIHIEKVYDEVLVGKSNLTILDCGANCGLATQYFREFGKVYSFEPSPDQFEALSKNKEFNGWDNVEIFNMAMAANKGEAIFHTNSTNMTAGSLDNQFYKALSLPGGHQYETGVRVKTTTLLDFITEKDLTVDFVKMDIEGQETEILDSPDFIKAAEKIKAILIEFHSEGWERHVELLEKLGFKSKRFQTNTVNILFTK